MSKEFNTVMVDIDRYSQLIAIEARLDSLKRFASKSEYSISQEDIAAILGFNFPNKQGDNDARGDI